MTRYETSAKVKAFFAYSTNLCHCSKRSGIGTFIPTSFCELETAQILKFNALFLFAGDDVKTNYLEL